MQERQALDNRQECAICYQYCIRPVRCKGPCKNLFCLRCVAEAKKTNDRCPNRCSVPPFEVSLIPQLPPALICPFAPQKCKQNIQNSEARLTHYLRCQHISPEQRQALTLKNQFKCIKGHNLVFLHQEAFVIIYGLGNYPTACLQSCSLCKQETVCLSLCIQCSSKQKRSAYCATCRKIPMTKTKCPMGHNIKTYPKLGNDRLCDYCLVPAKIIGPLAYGYCKCNFDLCQKCHQMLPIQHPLTPLPAYDLQQLHDISAVQENKRGRKKIDPRQAQRRLRNRPARLQLINDGGQRVWRRRQRVANFNFIDVSDDEL